MTNPASPGFRNSGVDARDMLKADIGFEIDYWGLGFRLVYFAASLKGITRTILSRGLS